MNIELLTNFPILNSSTYSKMAILKDYDLKKMAALFAKFKNNGYEQKFSYPNKNLNTTVFYKEGDVVTLCRNGATGELRVMWEDEKYNSLDTIVKPESVGGGETTLSQIGVGAYGHFDDDPMISLHYLIKNSDGHAIILDGGCPIDENADDIYKALESHNIAKDENGKYIIDAWFFSHAHGDHIGAFQNFAPKYSDRATVKYIIYNFPGDGNVASREGDFDRFENNINTHFPEAKRIVPRAGLSYYFGNVTMEVLYSPDMLYCPERRLPYFNDTSTIITLKAEGVKALFMGDGGEMCAEFIMDTIKKSAIPSTFVQITHHGLYTSNYITPRTADEVNAMTREEKDAREAERHVNKRLTELYTTAAPKVGLWPMGDTLGQPRNGRTTVMRDWSRYYGQTAYFVDTAAEDSGYNGVNIVKKGDLVTYTASSETELMITKFLLTDKTFVLLTNETWESYLEKNL